MAWGRKTVTVDAPEWNEDQMVSYNWCINHGVKIAPWACSSDRDNYFWWIDVEVNGAKRRSPFKYNGRQINEKIFELYKFYYDKNTIRNSK